MLRSLSCLVVLGCAAAPAPPPRAPAQPAQPAFARLGFYVGEWACDGTEYDAHGTATNHMKLAVRVAPAVDNWLSVAVFQDGRQVTSELKGYDPALHAFRHLWAANDGTAGTLTAAAGWQGDQIIFDEDHPEAASKTRMTFKRIDDTHYEHRADVDDGHGYRVEFTKTCKKVS